MSTIFCGIAISSGLGATDAGKQSIFKFALRDGRIISESNTIRVAEGALIKIEWKSDTIIKLHLHGYDLYAVAKPGKLATMKFNAHTAGRFPVSLHGHGHGHGAVLYLEVYPK